MALVTLQAIFQDAFPAYEQRHALPAHVRRAAHALIRCRTAALGGHIQACPDGHVARVWYNSYRHRACPPCAYLQTERWLARQRARLLACDHSHVIFTLPHDLNALWLANVPVMTTLLLQAVRDMLGTLLADPKYLGAQPGIIAALHTWSQTLVLPPHLHCLVTGCGLTPAGQWVAVRHGFLLPARVVMAVFRGKRVAAPWWPGAGRDAVWGTLRARSAPYGPTGEAGRACDRREGVEVTRPKLHSASAHSVSGRSRPRSVQPNALRSAQGRAGVHRGALSPEHSR